MTLPILCLPPSDNTLTTLAQAYAHNSSTTVSLATGAGLQFGSPSPTRPVRFAMIKQSQSVGGTISISDPTKMGIYHATGISGDMLSGVTFESGTNQDFVAGDFVAGVVCSKDITDLQTHLLSGGAVHVLANGTVVGDGVTDDGPAIQDIITANPGHAIFFPMTQASSSPSYYSSITLNITAPGTQLAGESAGFQGGTTIRFARGVTGINIEPTASGSSITDLMVDGQSPWEQIYPSQAVIPSGFTGSALADRLTPTADGIRVGANLCRLTNVIAQNFGRHGFCLSNAEDGGSAVSDCSTLISCYAQENRGYGFYVQGGDSNASTFINCNASVNQLGGINDQSFLGNTWYSPKTDENHFDSGSGYSPSAAPVASITRASNVVTLTLEAPYSWSDPGGTPFVPGHGITVAGVSDPSFDGTFIVASVSGAVITYSQTGADATPSATGATAQLATQRASWAAAGLPTGGAFITSQDPTSRTTLVNPYTEGGQSPDGTGNGGMQLGSGTTVIGGIFGTAIDFTYGTPAVFMGCTPGFAEPGFYGSFPSVYIGNNADFQYQEVVGSTGDYQSIRYRRSFTNLAVATLWTEKEGPGGYYYYESNPLTDAASVLRLGFIRTVNGGVVTGGPTYLNSQGTDPVQINLNSGTAAACGTGGLQVGGPIACASGPTSARPTAVAITGSMFFDTTLGKPIWRNGSNWIDASGAVV